MKLYTRDSDGERPGGAGGAETDPGTDL